MILKIDNIKLSYTVYNETFNLLKGVNLDVEVGKVTALIGGNGAGKTSIFNIISGFEKGYLGNVFFEGKNINKYPPHVIASKGIGRLFQGGQLLNGLTLLENLKMASNDRKGERPFFSMIKPGMIRKIEAEKEERAKAVLSRLFGVDCKYLQMLDDDASSFSYGEQRLLAMARLLIGHNRLLLLDEPTAGVNPVYIENIEKIIRDMVEKENVTVLLIEHNMQFVQKVADTCAYLNDGIISKVGSTIEVLNDMNVINSYLGI